MIRCWILSQAFSESIEVVMVFLPQYLIWFITIAPFAIRECSANHKVKECPDVPRCPSRRAEATPFRRPRPSPPPLPHKLRQCSSLKRLNLMEKVSFCSRVSGYLREVYNVSVWETVLSPRSCFGRRPSGPWPAPCPSRLAGQTREDCPRLRAAVLALEGPSGYLKAYVLR